MGVHCSSLGAVPRRMRRQYTRNQGESQSRFRQNEILLIMGMVLMTFDDLY
jgi:hypothetical protein